MQLAYEADVRICGSGGCATNPHRESRWPALNPALTQIFTWPLGAEDGYTPRHGDESEQVRRPTTLVQPRSP